MHAPVNKLIVTLEKKFYDSVTFESGQKIFFDPSWQPQEYAMLYATVVSVPNGIIQRYDYKGVTMDIKPGDKVLIRYDVVFAYKDQPDRDTPIYKNLLFNYNEESQRYEELWLCDILQIFAIITETETKMINGYVLLDLIKEQQDDYSSLIIKPDNYKNVELKHLAKIRAVNSKKYDLKRGDIVYVNPTTVMCYQIDTDKFYVIKESNILAKSVK